jgi:geranylgeranyl pyrophosphate synthase
VPAVVRELAPELARCEARLAECVAAYASAVSAPAGDTLRAGGKRIRPLLVFCAAPRGRPDRRPALTSTAAAVELVHMATLVHDDLIDGASLRRGRPTVARALGAERAVQVGDFLFARAFGELTRAGSTAAVRTLAGAALDLSRGELDQHRAALDVALTEEQYLRRCRRKTAALFAAACRLGAYVGGADARVQARLETFGTSVGIAFQIFDDILDLTGDPVDTGKPRGTDLRGGTITLPVILALLDEPSLAGPVLDAARGLDGPAVEGLCDLLAAHPGTARARERALAFVATARDAVEGPLDGVDPAGLLEIADGVVDRYS